MNTLQTRDFPDWVGPMLVKELRQGLKARAFELTFITLQVVLAVVVGYHALLYSHHGAGFDASGLHGMFWFIVGLQLLGITPLRALGGLANERKANTLELIFMTGLSSWRIAWGKWVSLFSQALLFILAVLPYGVLRYFFGVVNLSDDFVTLGIMLLASAVLSALAIAISGMPVFVRVGAIIFFLMSGMGFFQMMMMLAFRGSMGSSGMFFSGALGGDATWLLFVYDALLLGIGALAIGAWTIAPAAENHALRQRLLVLCAWLPVPLMHLLGANVEIVQMQLVFFMMLGVAVCWFHFAMEPEVMRVHLEPFARRGTLAQFTGFFFQPGWPGAVLFLVLAELLFLGTAYQWLATDPDETVEVMAIVLMAGAAVMTPPLIWRLFRLRTKATLVLHTLILGLCGGAYAMIDSLNSVSLGHYKITALLPPFGFFAMLDNGLNDQERSEAWLVVAMVAFGVSVCLLLLLSRGCWAKLMSFGRDIRTKPKPMPAPLEVAA